MKRQQQMQANVWGALPQLQSPPQPYSPVLSTNDAASLQLLQAMGGSAALLQQQLLTAGTENLLAPIGMQNLVTLAAMSQPTAAAAAAAAPLCMANLLSKGAGVERTLTAGLQPALSTPDLSTYGSLLTNATINAAAMAAAGKQVEGNFSSPLLIYNSFHPRFAFISSVSH